MALSPGQKLQNGKYTVKRELKRREYDITYLAEYSDGERWVIKVLNPAVLEALNPEDRDRLETLFWQEAVKIAKCSGTPHIVQVEMPFKEGTVACFPMEYLGTDSVSLGCRVRHSVQAWLQKLNLKEMSDRTVSTFPFIPLSVLLLCYLLIGTLYVLVIGVWLVPSGVAGALIRTVTRGWARARFRAWSWVWVWVWAVSIAGAWAWIFPGTGAGAWAVSMAGALPVFMAGNWAEAVAVKSLKKLYDSRSISIILGMTSTLGLVLGGVLGWWLKLKDVSLPF